MAAALRWCAFVLVNELLEQCLLNSLQKLMWMPGGRQITTNLGGMYRYARETESMFLASPWCRALSIYYRVHMMCMYVKMAALRSVCAVMNCVLMEEGGTEGIPETGKAKPFITVTDTLCLGRNFALFLGHYSNRPIRILQTKEKLQIQLRPGIPRNLFFPWFK